MSECTPTGRIVKRVFIPYNNYLTNYIEEIPRPCPQQKTVDGSVMTFVGWSRKEVAESDEDIINPIDNKEAYGSITNTTVFYAQWQQTQIEVMCGEPQIHTPQDGFIPYDGDSVTVNYWIMENDVQKVVDGLTLDFLADDSVCELISNEEITDESQKPVMQAKYSVSPNDTGIIRQIGFQASYNGIVSDPIKFVYQEVPNMLPDCDYFLFNYQWTEQDGPDLTSVTIVTLEDDSHHIVKTIGPIGSDFGRMVKDETNTDILMEYKRGSSSVRNESTVICLTKIVTLYKSLIENGGTINIDIYANWWRRDFNMADPTQVTGDGNMNIICNAYKREEGEINYQEDINNSGNPILPKETLSDKWQYIEENIHVKAAGARNNAIVRTNGGCADAVYSQVATVSVKLPSNTKAFEKYQDTDNGLDNYALPIYLCENANASNHVTTTVGSATPNTYTYEGLFYNTWSDRSNNRIDVEIEEVSVKIGETETSLDLDGTPFNAPDFISNLKVERDTTYSTDDFTYLKISFELLANTTSSERNFSIYLYASALYSCMPQMNDHLYFRQMAQNNS